MTCITFGRIMMPAIAAAIMTVAGCAASAQEADRTQPGFLDNVFGGSDRFGSTIRSGARARTAGIGARAPFGKLGANGRFR